jgi:hypothetical protein
LIHEEIMLIIIINIIIISSSSIIINLVQLSRNASMKGVTKLEQYAMSRKCISTLHDKPVLRKFM